jgi:hypothetical protein
MLLLYFENVQEDGLNPELLKPQPEPKAKKSNIIVSYIYRTNIYKPHPHMFYTVQTQVVGRPDSVRSKRKLSRS